MRASWRGMVASRVGGLALAATALGGCHSRPPAPAAVTEVVYAGRIAEMSFATRSRGPHWLTLLTLRTDSTMAARAGYAPLIFARVDSATRLVISPAAAQDSVGSMPGRVPGLQRGAYVRLWYRGAPTSRTATEFWGNARLIVVDSVGAPDR